MAPRLVLHAIDDADKLAIDEGGAHVSRLSAHLGIEWRLVEDEEQETYSYYGVLNTVAFNVGYHNEHHDFPSVPWIRLPRIKEGAPAYYNSLHAHKSWTLLFFRFLFDREISLFSRIVRRERGKVALTDLSPADKEYA